LCEDVATWERAGEQCDWYACDKHYDQGSKKYQPCDIGLRIKAMLKALA
jgi:hypothetical protein